MIQGHKVMERHMTLTWLILPQESRYCQLTSHLKVQPLSYNNSNGVKWHLHIENKNIKKRSTLYTKQHFILYIVYYI